MNYLAHLLLSGDDPNILVGNFIADFVRKKEEAFFSEEIQRGFLLHRKIDEFTDNHPSVALGKALIRAKHSKYAPVILDIHYDHLLYKNWDRYGDIPYEVFTRKIYIILKAAEGILIPHLANRIHNMVEDRWLDNYKTRKGMVKVFKYLQRRVSRPSLIHGVMDTLWKNNKELEAGFHEFFPELLKFSWQQMNALDS